jgi:hypothetical protein
MTETSQLYYHCCCYMRTNIIRNIRSSYVLNGWLSILLLTALNLTPTQADELLSSARTQQQQLIERYGLARVPFWQQACDHELEVLKLSEFEACIIIDAGFANAWSLAHGVVILTAGLLQQVRNPDQLAHILAHEHAHLTLRHHQQAAQLVQDPPLFFTKSRIKKFYRQIEREADEAADQWLRQHQRDPLQIQHYFLRLEQLLDEQSADHDKLRDRIRRTGLPAEVIVADWHNHAP